APTDERRDVNVMSLISRFFPVPLDQRTIVPHMGMNITFIANTYSPLSGPLTLTIIREDKRIRKNPERRLLTNPT
ncbi:hypothetical protein, partial [Palaeococcus sp. (in: euryarchaeotes)]